MRLWSWLTPRPLDTVPRRISFLWHPCWAHFYPSVYGAVSEQFQSSFRAVSEPFQSNFWTVSEQSQNSFRAIFESFQSSFRAISERGVSQFISSDYPRLELAKQKAVSIILDPPSWSSIILINNQEGYLPLHVAIESGNIHVSRELLSHNADVQVKATYGLRAETAFHAAARRRDVELLRLLSENGSPIDATNVTRSESITRYNLMMMMIEKFDYDELIEWARHGDSFPRHLVFCGYLHELRAHFRRSSFLSLLLPVCWTGRRTDRFAYRRLWWRWDHRQIFAHAPRQSQHLW